MHTEYITIYICYMFLAVEKLLKKEDEKNVFERIPFEFSDARDTE